MRETDATWSRKLFGKIKGAIHAPILGVDVPVADPAEKRELYRTTGAVAVDMNPTWWRGLPANINLPLPRRALWSIRRTGPFRPLP